MLEVIKLFVRRMLMGKGKGILKIPPQNKVDDFANDLFKKFKQNGVSDEAVTNPNDVKAIWNQITNREAQIFTNNLKDVLQKPDPFKKAGEVFDLKGNKIKNPQNIMGGEEIIETEAQILAKLNKGNKESLSNMRYEKAVKAEEAKAAADEDYIMKVFDPEDFATGGRAGLYQGGQAEIEPNLSDIGHGSDALMARNSLLTPGSQATTSTGLNYLLGEDNDTTRVPYKHGDMVLPKEKPMDEYMLKQVLSPAGIRTLDPKTREMFIEMYKKKIREKNSKADGGPARQNFGIGGMSKRAFLKWMAGTGAGIGAAKSGLFGLLKGGATKSVIKDLTTVPINNIEGMPVWFKPLVNKVIKEGDDVTKKFADADRQIVHTTKLPNSQTDVIVTQDLSTGNVSVDIGMGKHGFKEGLHGQPVRLEYKAAEDIMRGPDGDELFKVGVREPHIKVKRRDEMTFDQKKHPDKAPEEFWVEEAEFSGGHPENVKFEDVSYEKFGEHGSNFDEVEKFATGKVKKTKKTESRVFGKKYLHEGNDMASGGRVPLAEGGDPGTSSAEEVREAWKDYLKEKGTGTFKGSWKEFQPIWIRANLASGGRIGYGKGDIVTKGIPALLDLIKNKFGKNAITTADKLKTPQKTLDREMFKGAFKNSEQSFEQKFIEKLFKEEMTTPTWGRIHPGNKEWAKRQVENHNKKMPALTKKYEEFKRTGKLPEDMHVDEINEHGISNNEYFAGYDTKKLRKGEVDYDYYREILDDAENDIVQGDETLEALEGMVKEKYDYHDYMYDQYKTGKLDKYMSMEAKGKRVLDADDAGRPSGYNMDEEYEIRAAMDEAERIKIAKWRAKEELAKSKESPWFTDSKTLTPEDELRKEFPGIDDNTIRNILTDKNPQRIAEVKATMKEALKMQEKGMGHEEIIQTFKKTKPTKHATGGRVSLSGGGLAGMLGE